jgi:outer membrane autotransporter protein
MNRLNPLRALLFAVLMLLSMMGMTMPAVAQTNSLSANQSNLYNALANTGLSLGGSFAFAFLPPPVVYFFSFEAPTGVLATNFNNWGSSGVSWSSSDSSGSLGVIAVAADRTASRKHESVKVKPAFTQQNQPSTPQNVTTTQTAVQNVVNAPGPAANDLLKNFLNQLSPGLYTTLPTILFNSANVQNTQIQQRLEAVRNGESDLSSLSPANEDPHRKDVTESGRNVVAPGISDDEKKWTSFVDGNGMWSEAPTVNDLPSYNSYAGGVQAGASREIVKGLTVGPYVGYQGTRVDFTGSNGGGSSAIDNSVRFGLFSEYAKGGFYADGIVGGAYNSVAVNHGINISGNGNSFNSMAVGNVSGGEFDSLFGTGYDFKAGKLTFGPLTSLQYTYLRLGRAQENGAGPLDQNIGSQNTGSLLYTLGGQAHYDVNLGPTVKLEPFVSLAWQHEFLQNGYNLSASILGQSYNYQTVNAGRDQYIAGIGGNLVLTQSLSAYLVCNLINGDSKVFSQSVSGGINLKF